MANENEADRTITGRTPSKPALQNILIRTEVGRELCASVRKACTEPLPPGEYTMKLDSVFDGITPGPFGRDRAMRLNFEIFYGGEGRTLQHVLRKL